MAKIVEPAPDFYRKATNRSTHRLWGNGGEYPAGIDKKLCEFAILKIMHNSPNVRAVIETYTAFNGDFEYITLLGAGYGVEPIWTRKLFPNAYITAYELDYYHNAIMLPKYCDLLGIELKIHKEGDIREVGAIGKRIANKRALVMCRNPEILYDSKHKQMDMQLAEVVAYWIKFCRDHSVVGLFTFATELEKNAVVGIMGKKYGQEIPIGRNHFNDVEITMHGTYAATDQFVCLIN